MRRCFATSSRFGLLFASLFGGSLVCRSEAGTDCCSHLFNCLTYLFSVMRKSLLLNSSAPSAVLPNDEARAAPSGPGSCLAQRRRRQRPEVSARWMLRGLRGGWSDCTMRERRPRIGACVLQYFKGANHLYKLPNLSSQPLTYKFPRRKTYTPLASRVCRLARLIK